jgi:DNA-binding transcriptional LysR family regulator
MVVMLGIRCHNEAVTRNLDTGLVRTFVAVADKASMTAAANTLHLTQGAVSQQVKRLEEMLGCSLFQRDRRGLRLTSPGERLFSQARKLLALHDEIWAEMTTAAVEGQVRLGVPPDLIGSRLTPVLKAYADAFPKVELSLVCAPSPELVEALAMGRVDLAVVEEPTGPSAGECLSIERLVWIGAKAGTAHLKRPLPVSLVADICAFRPAVLAALTGHGTGWRTVFENGSMEAALATVRADLAVSAWLASTVPPDLDILPSSFGLPELLAFAINLHLPRRHAGAAATEMAQYIRDGLVRHRHAA